MSIKKQRNTAANLIGSEMQMFLIIKRRFSPLSVKQINDYSLCILYDKTVLKYNIAIVDHKIHLKTVKNKIKHSLCVCAYCASSYTRMQSTN